MEHTHHHHCDCQEEHHHHHHHHHDEGGGLGRKLAVIIAAVLLLGGAIAVEKSFTLKTWQLLLVYLLPYLLSGFETLKEAFEGISRGDIFNEHFLMTVATAGALCIGFLPGAESQFPEAVAVMLFFQVGELFEGYAEGRSRAGIAHLMNIRPDVATVVRDGQELTVAPSEVAIGETIVIRPGEKIPLDGVIISGTTSVDTAALTGESLPADAAEGDEVLSGCINLSGVITVRTTKSYSHSTVSRIISLVEDAAENKSRSENFITRFARVYTPIVVFLALALAFIPPLFADSFQAAFPQWLYRALVFLVVSCPCALVISVPLTFFGGIGGASRQGILIKGGNFIDALSKLDTVVFDKTGTLTQGHFVVEAVHPEVCDQRHLLHLAAHVEHYSVHPIGEALREAFPEEATDNCTVSDVTEFAGEGIVANVSGKVVGVGNSALMERLGAAWRPCSHVGTIIHVSIDGEYAGHIVINDKIKEDSPQAIRELKDIGVRRLVMLTGDRKAVAAKVADQLGIEEFYSELMPSDKVARVEDLLAGTAAKRARGTLAFVGDGINDAPVLSRSDVGIAMGGLGSEAAIEAADVVLMDDKPSKISKAIKVARRTIGIAKQNAIFAIGVKVSVLALASIGLGTMWMAVFADVGVTVLAVLNAMRALKSR